MLLSLLLTALAAVATTTGYKIATGSSTGYPGYIGSGYNLPPVQSVKGYPQTGYPQTGYPQTGYPQTGYPNTVTNYAYPDYNLKSALVSIGLTSFYDTKYSMGGFQNYLQRKKVPQAQFIARIKKYGQEISEVVAPMQNQYKGVVGDLWQLAVLDHYGGESNVNRNIPLTSSFNNYIETIKTPSSTGYDENYVDVFLKGFKDYQQTNFKPQVIVEPVVTTNVKPQVNVEPIITYPGYEYLSTLNSIGLPELNHPKRSLGGLVAYLEVTETSKSTFISALNLHREKIRRKVLGYQKQYSGYRADLLQLAVLRYYGINKPNNVKFSVAFQEALAPSFKYSESYVSSFLTSFDKYLTEPAYPGYDLKPVLIEAGLPELTAPQYSLSGLSSYLQSKNYAQAVLVSRIQNHAPQIKSTIYRHQKQYSGFRADLLQLCAIRYYSLPLILREKISFDYAFQGYMSSQNLKQYDTSFVSRFLDGFVDYIRYKQSNNYSGVMW